MISLTVWPEGPLLVRNKVPLLLQSSYGADAFIDITVFWSFTWGGTPSDVIAVQRLYPDEAGYVEMDLSSLLTAAFRDRFHNPWLYGALGDVIYGEGQLVISEVYNGSETDSYTKDFTGMNGGVMADERMAVQINPQDQFAGEQFLTWKPDGAKVSKGQPELLYIMIPGVPAPINDIDVVFTLRDSNNTTTTKTVSYTGLAGLGQIYCIPVGYDANTLDSILTAGRFPVSYTVEVFPTGSGTAISPVRTYMVDLSYQPYEKWLMFVNSLGCMECMRLIGEGSSKVTYEDIDASNFVSFRTNLSAVPSSEERIGSSELVSTTKNSGWITAEELDWIRDLRLSRNVFEYEYSTRYSNVFLNPIRITKKEFQIQKDNVDLNATAFEYERILQGAVYSPFIYR